MDNDWELCSLMVAVDDMAKAVKHYGSVGITGFSPARLYDGRSNVYTNLKVSDPKELASTFKTSNTPMLGSISFGLDQPVSGQPFQKDFLIDTGKASSRLSSTSMTSRPRPPNWLRKASRSLSVETGISAASLYSIPGEPAASTSR